MKTTFPVLWPLLNFQQMFSAALSQHHVLGFEIAEQKFHHFHYFAPSNASYDPLDFTL